MLMALDILCERNSTHGLLKGFGLSDGEDGKREN